MSTHSVSRRSVVSGIGGATILGLSGCLKTVSEDIHTTLNDERSATEISPTVHNVEIQELPESIPNSSKSSIVVSDDITETIESRSGVQLRVNRPGNTTQSLSAVYTPTQTTGTLDTTRTKTLWMTAEGMKRITADIGWNVSVTRTVTQPTISNRETAKNSNELIEQTIYGNDYRIIFLAPYGGDMMPGTSRQATRIASNTPYASWTVYGYSTGNAMDTWYIPPEQLHPASFPQLGSHIGYDHPSDYTDAQYDSQFNYAISFHTDDSTNSIILGGLASDEHKNALKNTLENEFKKSNITPKITVAQTGLGSNTDPSHITNAITTDKKHGITITQPPTLLQSYSETITDAIITHYTQ